MKIDQLDHLVLTLKNLQNCLDFYQGVLNMQHEVFADDRHALKFGLQKINLHIAGLEFEPKAALPMPGSADLCFITRTPLDKVVKQLQQHDLVIEEGPIPRTGATGPLLSVYIRDPDRDLVEIANQV